jgi:hypothetical protein
MYLSFFREGLVVGLRVHAEGVEDGVAFVAAITAGIDADGGEFAAFAPAFEGEGGNTKDFGDFTDGE